MDEMETLDESCGSELEELDSGSEEDGKQLEKSRNPLMLRKKGIELSQAFRKILSKNRPRENERIRGSDDESVVSSAIRQKEKEKIKKRGYYEVPQPGEDMEHDQREKKLARLATKGVVQMLNTVSRIHKEKQIENNRAIPIRKDPSKTASAADATMKTEDGTEDRPEWEVLQDGFLEKAIDGEDWSDQSSSDISLEDRSISETSSSSP